MKGKNRASVAQESYVGKNGRHGKGATSYRLCVRWARVIFVVSLFAFFLSAAPGFIWLFAPDQELDHLSTGSTIAGPLNYLHGAQYEPLFSRAIVEVKPELPKYGRKVHTKSAQTHNRRPRMITNVLKAVKKGGRVFSRMPPVLSDPADFSNSLQLVTDRSITPDMFASSWGIKIFVYDLPAKYNSEWLVNPRCSSHLFAAEVAIHQNLLLNPARTLDPNEADYFFLPVYISCNFSTRSGFPYLGRAPMMLQEAVSLVSKDMPFWNRSAGRDHIIVVTHDYGACFHAMEPLAIAAGIPNFLRNSIILQTFGQKGNHPCQAVKHIQIPPYIPPLDHLPDPEHQTRNIFAFFRGKIELHPKNESGYVYSRGVRTVLWRKFSHDRRFYIKRNRSEHYRLEILRSVFCLCPLGWAPWSPRIVESVALGCVPVIIADNISLPFSNVIEWDKISLTIPEKDAPKLGKILKDVSRSNLTAIQRHLWRKETREALLYHSRMLKGDAMWQILHLLSQKKLRPSKSSSSLQRYNALHDY